MAKAAVFGAAGVSGWGLCRALLDYPAKTTFDSVIGLTLHPVTRETDYLTTDGRLALYSGIDLTAEEGQVERQLRQTPGFCQVTHVYYVGTACGLSRTYDFGETAKINLQMFQTTLRATVGLCEKLEHFSWQSGSLWYGGPFRAHVQKMGVPLPPPPFSESGPRLPDPIAQMIPFYGQHDLMDAFHQAGAGNAPSTWTWTSPRADTIIGFAPHVSPHNLALSLGSYLAIVRLLSPDGAELAFPGTRASYAAAFTVTTQTHLAQTTIQLSLAAKTHPALSGQAFNISTDYSEPVTWEALWPRLLSFFGLRGVGPAADRDKMPFGVEWVERNRELLADAEANVALLVRGLDKRVSWQYLEFLLGAEVERALDTSKVTALVQKSGWQVELAKAEDAFFNAWKQAQETHLLPKF